MIIKKDLIVETSIKILAQKGYFNTTTKMISEKASIAVGTIYTYFKTKESILDYIFLKEYKKRVEYLKSLQKLTCSHTEKFNLFLDFHFHELESDQDLGIVLVQESINPELQHLQGVKNFAHQLPVFFKEILDDALQVGEIRELNTAVTARIIFSTIRGTVLSIKSSKEDCDLESVKQELKSFISHAINKY